MTELKYIEFESITDDPRLEAMCLMYWQLKEDNPSEFVYLAREVREKFGVTDHYLRKLVASSCLVRIPTYRCGTCGRGALVQTRHEYKLWIDNRNGTEWICHECYDASVRQVLEDAFPKTSRVSVDIDTLTLEMAVYIMGFIRAAADEHFTQAVLLPPEFEDKHQRLAPTEDLHFQILGALLDQKFICPHPASAPEIFTTTDLHEQRELLDLLVLWLPIGGIKKTEKSLFEELNKRFLLTDWPDGWYEQIKPLWQKIALHECIEYLLFSLDLYQLPFAPGEKTIALFEHLLCRWHVAQIYNFIWRSVKEAAAYSNQKGMTRGHAASWVIGTIERTADRANADGWEIKAYRRDSRRPQTIVSRVFFDTALHIGEEGFTTLPDKIIPRRTDVDEYERLKTGAVQQDNMSGES